MEPRPLPHQENPMAYEALLASPPKPASAPAAFRLSCLSGRTGRLALLPSALLYSLPGTWFFLTAARQAPPPPSSLTFSAASLDQPCNAMTRSLQIFHIPPESGFFPSTDEFFANLRCLFLFIGLPTGISCRIKSFVPVFHFSVAP